MVDAAYDMWPGEDMALTPTQIKEAQRAILKGKRRGRRDAPRQQRADEYKNDLERAYSERLHILQLAGEVKWWAYERIKFKLAKRSWYVADFAVIREGEPGMEIHETKGFMRDDAAVKLRNFLDVFWPVRLFIVRLVRGQFEIEERTP